MLHANSSNPLRAHIRKLGAATACDKVLLLLSSVYQTQLSVASNLCACAAAQFSDDPKHKIMTRLNVSENAYHRHSGGMIPAAE